MRKTLVALAVVISVVLLQTPAWAPTATTKPRPNIYVVQVKPSARAPISATRTVDVGSEKCKNGQLAVTFSWGKTVHGTTANKNGKYLYRATLRDVPENVGTVDEGDVVRATCNGKELPFTGAASASLLPLGVSLLVIGALLVLSSRRHPLMGRR